MPNLLNRRWKAVINGQNSPSDPLHSVTIKGCIVAAKPDSTIYDLIRSLGDELAAQNAAMALPSSFQITLYPQSTKSPKSTKSKQ